MTPSFLRSIAAAGALAACLSACSRSEGATRADAKSAPAAPAAATGTSSGAGATALPTDSISQKADAGRIAGPESGKLWVIMASDFQCPFCKQWHDAGFAKVMDYAKTGKIRLAFINMPLSMHANAMPAAEAAMCAAVQGKFWEMHESLFKTQEGWAELPNASAKFEALATAAGVNMPQWRECVSKHLTAALITADRDRLRAAGVNSTPTFFVNGKMITKPDGGSAGAGSDVPAAIEAALKMPR
jgi:protein-disulfide isomerase